MLHPRPSLLRAGWNISSSAQAGPSSRPYPPSRSVSSAPPTTAAVPGSSEDDQHKHIPTSTGGSQPNIPHTVGKKRRRTVRQQVHPPLVSELLSQLYATGKQPDPESVWSSYYKFFRPEATREGLPLRLKTSWHRMVLRAISPSWSRATIQARQYKDNMKLLRETRGEYGSEWEAVATREIRSKMKSGMDSEISTINSLSQTYVDRVVFVLERLREVGAREAGNATAGPSIEDYNHVLSHAAEAGDNSLADLVWQQIHELGLQPSTQSYLLMIRANSRSIVTIANSPWSAQQRTTGKGNAEAQDQKMAVASRSAAAKAVQLIQDMIARGLTPDRNIIDYTLKLLRLGGHFNSFQLLLKMAYSVDLTLLDAQSSEALPADRPQISTQTLNSILLALGERKSVSEMLSAFEILTSSAPLEADSKLPLGDGLRSADITSQSVARASVEPEDPAARSSFKGFIKDLFYTDAAALSHSGVLGAGHLAQGNLPSSETSNTSLAVLPNKATFENLISHCCGAVEGSGVPEAEVVARQKGTYRIVARYLLNDALDRYRLSLRQMVPTLGLKESEGENFSLQPLPGFGQKPPSFQTPAVCPKMQHFAPIYVMASRRRDQRTLTWLGDKVKEALALMTKEELTLRYAARLWRERPASHSMEQWAVGILCATISKRADWIGTESRVLRTWSEKHLEPRTSAIAALKTRKLEARQQKFALQAQQEQERQAKKARSRQEREEANRASATSPESAVLSGPTLPLQYAPLSAESSRGIHTLAGSALRRRDPAIRLPPRVSPFHPLLRATFATSAARPTSHTAGEPTPAAEHADAVIVGGGVVGLALACSLISSEKLASSASLAGSPLRLVLLEASNLDRLRTWAQDKQGGGVANDVGHSQDITGWENRVVSLTMENWLWLQDIGVTQYLVHRRVQPITSMHVSDGLSGAALDLGEGNEAMAQSGSPLSKMIELSNLQQAMLRFIQDTSSAVNVEVWDQTKVEGIQPSTVGVSSDAASQHVDAWPNIQTASSSSQRSLRPRLLIGADGGSSPVRKYAGIDKFGWGYGCNGLVGTLFFDKNESLRRGHQIAYQRFLPTGTIAWLPLSTSAASTVWTLPPDLASVITALHRSTPEGQSSIMSDLVSAAWRLPWASMSYIFSLITSPTADPTTLDISVLRQEIKARLQAASEAGTLVSEEEVPPPVLNVAARSVGAFPLQVAHADAYLGSSLLSTASPSNSLLPANLLHSALSLTGFGGEANVHEAKGRTVLIGDAAHSIHPLAGQGLNLGLRDARVLTGVLGDAASLGGDWGSHDSLKPYEQQTYLHNQIVLSAVDHLHWLYAGTPIPSNLDYHGEQGQAQPFVRRVAKDAFGKGVVWARSTGVEVLNELDWVKAKMQGFAGSKGAGGK